MATEREIVDLVAGDDFEIERVIKNLPTGQVLVKAWLTIKVLKSDPDPGLVQLAVTTTPASEGQILDDGTGKAEGVVQFQLSATDTALLTPKKRYLYDLQVKLVNGRVGTAEIGLIIPQQGITETTA